MECERCHHELAEMDGMMMCTGCFRLTRFLVDQEKAFDEPPREISTFPYKRINHFKEILSQIQGKESSRIPEQVMVEIKAQIARENLSESDLTIVRMRAMLKKLNYNRYYEHIPFIKNKLGIPQPTMTKEFEETLCHLFLTLQAPFARARPDCRNNFLSYHFTVYKLCEMRGERQCLPNLPLPKNRNKLMEQDAIWKVMCEQMGWTFLPIV